MGARPGVGAGQEGGGRVRELGDSGHGEARKPERAPGAVRSADLPRTTESRKEPEDPAEGTKHSDLPYVTRSEPAARPRSADFTALRRGDAEMEGPEVRGEAEVKDTQVGKRGFTWASLVAQWLRIRLPMQGTWVRALVREDPTCRRATKSVCHNC